MAAAKKQYVKFKTPVGTAQYPKLDKAYKWDDAAERSLPNPDGDMSTKLVVPNKDAQEFLKTIKTAIKDSGIKPKYVPYEDEVKDGEKTGNTIFKLKAYGKDRDGNTNKLKFYDASGNPVRGTIIVTGGSTLRLLGWISVAKMGCRLNIREVQIIDLAERDGEGFEAYEGGSFKTGLGEDDVEETPTTNNKDETSDDEVEETAGDDEEEF